MPRESDKASLPEELLGDVSWSFRDDPYPDRAAFVAAVAEMYREMEIEGWNADEVVLRCPRVRILCEDVEDEDGEDLVLDIRSDDGIAFTAGELLFKIHNGVAGNESLGDHVYFEGLHLQEQPKGKKPPVYEMWLGS